MSSHHANRKPAVAGRFYSDEPAVLREDIEKMFNAAQDKKLDNVAALVAPHAGYVFSGQTAAEAFKQIDAGKQYDTVFLLATSHSLSFNGASVYHAGHYDMPMGQVKVNRTLARTLTEKHSCFGFIPEAHQNEHSIEVLLPFLQYLLKDNFQIVPIVIGGASLSDIQEMAEALKPHFNRNNLFVVSTDFSHYPPYDEAVQVDKRTLDAILENDAEALLNTLSVNEASKIEGLSTSLCGWSAVLTLLKITEKNNNVKTVLLDYCNSGDSPYGSKDSVVGYGSLAFCLD